MARDIIALMGFLVVGTTAPLVASDRSLDLNGFTNVAVSGGVDVTIVAGTRFDIDADVSRRALKRRLDIRMRGDTLVIDRERGWSLFMLGMTDRYEVTVTMPELNSVHAAAGSDVVVRAAYGNSFEAKATSGAELQISGMNSTDVSLRTSSGAQLEIAGNCTRVDARATSGSDLDAGDMSCHDATARASSGANVDIFATQTADGRASSGGDIDIHGPAIVTDMSESSGGDVGRRG